MENFGNSFLGLTIAIILLISYFEPEKSASFWALFHGPQGADAVAQ